MARSSRQRHGRASNTCKYMDRHRPMVGYGHSPKVDQDCGRDASNDQPQVASWRVKTKKYYIEALTIKPAFVGSIQLLGCEYRLAPKGCDHHALIGVLRDDGSAKRGCSADIVPSRTDTAYGGACGYARTDSANIKYEVITGTRGPADMEKYELPGSAPKSSCWPPL